MTLGTLSQETRAAIIAAVAAPDLSEAFLDKEHVYTTDEVILWAAALGLFVRPGPTWWRGPLPPLAACAVSTVGLV
jgi:hypothetical protein